MQSEYTEYEVRCKNAPKGGIHTSVIMDIERKVLEKHFGPLPELDEIQSEYSERPITHLYEWVMNSEEVTVPTSFFVVNCLTLDDRKIPGQSKVKDVIKILDILKKNSTTILEVCKRDNLY